MSNISDLAELTAIANQFLRGKDFFVSTVLDRVRCVANDYPHDGAVRTAQYVLEKKANREGTLAVISQSDFQDIYEQVSGLGNKEIFRERLGDLLITEAPEKVASYDTDLVAGMRDGGNPVEFHSPDAAEGLYGLFDDHGSVMAAGSFIDNGKKGIEAELSGMGFKPSVEVVARDNSFVIYAANIDSAHGMVSAYVPAEIQNNSILMPSVFVSGDEFVDFTPGNLLAHAQEMALGKRSAAPHAILKTLNRLAGKQERFRKVADFETAVHLDIPGLYMDRVEEEAFEVVQPKVAMPAELEHLTEGQIRDALMESGIGYDKNIINTAKSVVDTELRSMGIACRKVSVASEFTGGLMLIATIAGKGGLKNIEVPVEIINGRTLMPSVFASGALVQPFDRENLVAFASSGSEYNAGAILSGKYGMSFKELHSIVLKNAAYGNFVEVEDALAVIGEQYGAELHLTAVSDLTDLLNKGYGDDDCASGTVDRYLKEACEKAANAEDRIKVNSTVMLLYPEEA